MMMDLLEVLRHPTFAHAAVIMLGPYVLWLLSRGKQQRAHPVHEMRHGTASQGTDGYYLSQPCTMRSGCRKFKTPTKDRFACPYEFWWAVGRTMVHVSACHDEHR